MPKRKDETTRYPALPPETPTVVRVAGMVPGGPAGRHCVIADIPRDVLAKYTHTVHPANVRAIVQHQALAAIADDGGAGKQVAVGEAAE